MDSLKTSFLNPPASHRAAPLWVWNDQMSREGISFQLTELHNHGFGGAFVHPRPGLITEYLADEWFELWGYALEKAKSLGMKLYIYDENSYPSGFAGGHVSSQLPDCLATGITYKIVHDPAELMGEQIVRAFACSCEPEIKIGRDITDSPRSEWTNYGDCFFAACFVKAGTSGWMGGFGYVDLLRPEVTKLFLETTHEKYYQHFGADFGDAVPALFTDEPNIGNGGAYTGGSPSLPFSFYFVHEFEKRYGYSLLDNLPCIFLNVQGERFPHPAEKVRYDYYTLIHDLWIQNTIEPTGRWCAEHNIAWTGHYLEHQWPFAYAHNASPSMQSFYEYHQWPAIDMLLANYLRDTDTHALTLTIQEIRSAANQFGKERTLCELYGAGGWDSTFEDYKRMGDWVLVNGINFINQHLTYGTITGARKRDHPQSFDWRSPWWDEYTQMNDYLGRASLMLSQGVMRQRILVLNPSTTAYLTPYEDEKGNLFSKPGFDAIQNPDMSHFLEMVQRLTDWQWDFDLGDEYTLKRHARIENGKLRLKAQVYDVIIVSGDMRNMLASTVALLQDMLDANGAVIACGEPGVYIEGAKNPSAYEGLKKRWTSVKDTEGLQTTLLTLLPERILSTTPWPAGLTHMRRALPNGQTVYFIVNHNKARFETELSLTGSRVSHWDLFTGESKEMICTAKDEWISFGLSLERNQSVLLVVDLALLIVDDEKKSEGAICPRESALPVDLKLVKTYAEKDNIFPIGYCDLLLDGRTYEDINVLRAADRIFRERGFDGNPWDNKVQFRNQLMDRNTFGLGSGFEAEYHFYVAPGFVPKRLRAVAEHPELCNLFINGIRVPWDSEPDELDDHFGAAEIIKYVRSGRNILTVFVPVFDVRMELESVYLRGDFAVEEREDRWVLASTDPLAYGAWKSQGYPFYEGAMRYEYAACLCNLPKKAQIDVREYGATAISISVNGKSAGILHADGRKPLEIGGLLAKGENHIALRVCGNMKNLMGPHFHSEKIRGSAWPAMWRSAPVYHTPKPSEYDLLAMGLFAEPVVTVSQE